MATVRIQTGDFDAGLELESLRSSNAGATVSFVGTVRDINEGEVVHEMELEHYPGMTEKALEAIAASAETRWSLANVLVIHRVGRLQPMDKIVLVAVTAQHRGEAFSACEYIIDYLKTEAPFWKKESTPEGARWVDARESDERARRRWGTAGKNGNEQ